MGLVDLVPALPLPLSQLGYRALNAKSAREAHNLSVELAEVLLRLGAIVRIAIWLKEGSTPGPAREALKNIGHASTGHWIEMLQATDAELAQRPNVALLPLAGVLGGLKTAAEYPQVLALAKAAFEEEVISRERLRSLDSDGLFGFFRFLADYRNHVAHGPVLGAAFLSRMTPLWHAALDEVLRSPIVFGGESAVLAVRDPSGWYRLAGRDGVAWEPPNVERAERALSPGQLGLIVPGAVVSLYPLALYRRDPVLETEHVVFLHRVDEELTYLDYTRGRTFRDHDAQNLLLSILADAGDEDARRERSRSMTSPEPEIELYPKPGSIVGGFEIEGTLGRGLTEMVYVARQIATGRMIALKVLALGANEERLHEERFRRGLIALARTDHENVVRVLIAQLDHPPLHYAMELVDGVDLSKVAKAIDRLLRSGAELTVDAAVAGALEASRTHPNEDEAPLDTPRARASSSFLRNLARLFAGAARGLEHLHEMRVVHRDIKPSNMVLTKDSRRLVLIDFGIAKPVDASRALTTARERQAGTARFMAPECFGGGAEGPGASADIYALGASLYEVATGRPLVQANTMEEVARYLLTRDVESVARRAPELPADLARIMTSATARDPRRRYSSAALFAEDLEAFAEGRALLHAAPGSWGSRVASIARRRAPLLAALVTATAIAAFLERTEVEICGGIVERYGVPRCDPAQSAALEMRHRITSKGGRVVEVAKIDALGRPIAGEATGLMRGVAVRQYFYGSDAPNEVVGRSASGEHLITIRYSRRSIGEIEASFHAPDGAFRTDGDTDIATHRLFFDTQGFLKEVRFMNAFGGIARTAEGFVGYRYQRDALGRVVSEIGIDAP